MWKTRIPAMGMAIAMIWAAGCRPLQRPVAPTVVVFEEEKKQGNRPQAASLEQADGLITQINEHVKELGNGQLEAIAGAVDALLELGPAGASAIASALLESDDVFVDLMLCDVLGRLRGLAVEGLPALFEVVSSETGAVREEAARAINWIASDTSADSSALIEAGLATVLPQLTDGLTDGDAMVCASSARALARLAPWMTSAQKAPLLEGLVAMCDDPGLYVFTGYYNMRPDTHVYPVRDAALWALERFGSQVPGTVEALSKHYVQRLAECIDLSAPGLEEVAAAVHGGKAHTALRLFKERVIVHLAERDFEPPWLWWMSLPAEQLLTNVHINSQYGSPTKISRYVGAPGAMDWLIHDPQNINWGEQTSRMTWTGTLMAGRYGGFLKDADPKYLRQWLGIWSDFDSNFLRQLILAEQHYEVFGYKTASNGRTLAGWRWPLHVAYRLEARIRGMSAAAHRAQETLAEELEGYQLVKLLLGARSEIELLTPWLTDDQVWRTGIPGNQLQHAASAVAQAIAAMPDFKDMPEWSNALDVYARRLIPYYPDGTEGEQSYHYNVFFLEFVRSCVNLFPSETRLPFVGELYAMGQYRYRFLSSIIRPNDGMTPGEGMANAPLHPEFQEVFEDPLVEKILSITQTQSGSAPAFDSIAFPWSGYHVLRNGWLKNDTHLYFKGGRKGVGHKSASGNAIQLTAFGRTMLTRGGRRSYGAGPFPGHNEYQLSSFAYNTIAVDGQSQRNENAPIQPDPIRARWLASPLLDFAEGRYDSGYVDIQEAIAHRRQVAYVRDLSLFVVTDRIGSGQERKYSQIWKFDQAYGEEQIQANDEHQTVRTLDPVGPNMTLHHFSSAPLHYEQYYGQQEPDVRGWVGCEPHFPAVDVHAIWEGAGPQQLITVLRPTRGLDDTPPRIESIEDEGVNGFRLTGDDGKQLAYWSAKAGPRPLGEGAIQVTGETLLIRDNGTGALHGLALGITEAQINGKPIRVSQPNFTFLYSHGQFSLDRRISIPEQFEWVNTEIGLAPSYGPPEEDGK